MDHNNTEHTYMTHLVRRHRKRSQQDCREILQNSAMACLGLVNQSAVSVSNKFRYTKAQRLPPNCVSSLSLFSVSSTLSTKSPKTYKRSCRVKSGIVRAEAEAEAMTTEKLGIKIERNPPDSRLAQLGVKSWPKYAFSALLISSLFWTENKIGVKYSCVKKDRWFRVIILEQVGM